MREPDEAEIAYYRTIEDHFAALRGTPFLLSPKDFALLRRWWQEGVPLAAVLAGLGEVWERRLDRDEDPVSSITYCRHAVVRHAKRLAAAQVGAAGAPQALDVGAAVAALASRLEEAARSWPAQPAVAAMLGDLARAVRSLPPEGESGAVDDTLAALEYATLDALLQALPTTTRQAIEREVEADLAGLAVEAEVRERTRRALLRKAVRREVGLPRLEVAAGAT